MNRRLGFRAILGAIGIAVTTMNSALAGCTNYCYKNANGKCCHAIVKNDGPRCYVYDRYCSWTFSCCR